MGLNVVTAKGATCKEEHIQNVFPLNLPTNIEDWNNYHSASLEQERTSTEEEMQVDTPG